MFKLHHYSLFHPKELDRKTRTFAAFLINDFGYMLVSLFIPVFLWIQGYSLFLISLYLILSFLIRGLFTFPAISLIKEFGPSFALKVGFISSLLNIGSMVAITSINGVHLPMMLLAAVANGVNAGLYYTARHINMELITNQRDAGATAGWMRVFETVIWAIAPLAGGILAEFFGSTIALLVSFAIIFVSVTYVIADKRDRHVLQNVKASKLKPSDIKYELVGNFARGFDVGVSYFAWPLFIYIIVDRVDLVGAVSTISFLSLIPLMIWTTRRVDKQSKPFLSLGVVVRTLVYPLRALVGNFFSAVGVNFVADFGDNFTGGPVIQRYYKRADELNRIKYTQYSEVAFSAGSVIAWVMIAILSLYFATQNAIIISFLITALVIPWILLYNKVD